MPLVILSGFPSSGKTTRCHQLRKFIEESEMKVIQVVGDQDLNFDKNDVYSDSKREKEVRGHLKSLVQRKISKEETVIIDSANYIKGYRYELYCVTKSAQTPHCVIHCDIQPATAWAWNVSRPQADQYSKQVFDALVMRYEPPENKNRWDSPLFVVQPDDDLPCQQICDALFRKRAPPPNLSTQSQPISSSNFIHELDKVTQSIVTAVLDLQKTCVPGDTVAVPGATDKIHLVKVLTLAELQRARRQFISFSKMHPTDDASKIANMFVQFINTSIK